MDGDLDFVLWDGQDAAGTGYLIARLYLPDQGHSMGEHLKTAKEMRSVEQNVMYREYHVPRVLLSGESTLRIYMMLPLGGCGQTLTVASTHAPTAHVVVLPESMQCLCAIRLQDGDGDVTCSITPHCDAGPGPNSCMTLLHVLIC
jgi:hypothetical protein